MKRILFIVAIFGTSHLFALSLSDSLLIKQIIEKQKLEIESLTSKVNNQQTIIIQQRNTLIDLTSKSTRLESTVDSLSSLIEANRSNIKIIADDLGTKIQETGQQAESKISELSDDFINNRLYWIIATLLILLLGALMYMFLGKRIKSSQTDVETQIRNTKKSL